MNRAAQSIVFVWLSLWISGLTAPPPASAQFQTEAKPASLNGRNLSADIPLHIFPSPDPDSLKAQDLDAEKQGLPYRCAVNLKANIDLCLSGLWEDLDQGSRILRWSAKAPDALALTCYFSEFFLPPGAAVFVYNPGMTQLLGAFTGINNQENSLFATRLLRGEDLIIELFEPAESRGLSRITLGELSYVYRAPGYLSGDPRGFGGSGDCEVNANCSEGDNWQLAKKAVARILVKVGTASYWCTGSLINNTRHNFKPYLLTADHCGMNASVGDLSQWIFYFNYESLDCPDPLTEPDYVSLVGAQKKAASGGNGQVKESDFYLVLLNNEVPANINPYFLGWNRQNSPATSGICLHHPQGDIKKISTFSNTAISTTWGSTPNTHWGVKWMATTNGHGVTEGGSSGSALINSQGQLVGQLSGGESTCDNLTGMDYYGKLSFSWAPPSSDSSNSLYHWLDPDNTGLTSLNGLSHNITYITANFTANKDTVTVGSSIDFTDRSYGSPSQWQWNFDGGTPSSSSEQHPQNITYNKTGVFAVSLNAANLNSSDTIIKKHCITVIPNIHPNPFNDYIHIDLGDNNIETYTFELFDILGQEMSFFYEELSGGTQFAIRLNKASPGLYYLRLKSPDLEFYKKMIYIKKTSE